MFRKRRHLAAVDAAVHLTPADLAPTADPSPTILDRGMASVSKLLGDLRREEITLEVEIAERAERLRQTRIAIAAFDTAERMLGAGDEEQHPAPIKFAAAAS